jgi:hypothetical protein
VPQLQNQNKQLHLTNQRINQNQAYTNNVYTSRIKHLLTAGTIASKLISASEEKAIAAPSNQPANKPKPVINKKKKKQ